LEHPNVSNSAVPPWEYLSGCSRSALGEFALARQNIAAKLRKSLRADMEAMIEALAEARVAQILIEHGSELGCTPYLRQESFDFESGAGKETAIRFPPKERRYGAKGNLRIRYAAD
jgi:hypothetical protein